MDQLLLEEIATPIPKHTLFTSRVYFKLCINFFILGQSILGEKYIEVYTKRTTFYSKIST
jgi:hypothetical protein